MCSVWRRCCDWTSQNQFVKFRAGHFSLDNAPWLGRPFEADSNQIKTLIENNQCPTTGEITDMLKISKSIKWLVKWKMCLLFYGKKNMDFLANPVPAVVLVCIHPSHHLCLGACFSISLHHLLLWDLNPWPIWWGWNVFLFFNLHFSD